VYIDSGHCLHTVKRVYESFNPQYEAVMQEPPRNPKSQLHELCYSVHFSPAEVGTGIVADGHKNCKQFFLSAFIFCGSSSSCETSDTRLFPNVRF
jgi:hypothetical protein